MTTHYRLSRLLLKGRSIKSRFNTHEWHMNRAADAAVTSRNSHHTVIGINVFKGVRWVVNSVSRQIVEHIPGKQNLTKKNILSASLSTQSIWSQPVTNMQWCLSYELNVFYNLQKMLTFVWERCYSCVWHPKQILKT